MTTEVQTMCNCRKQKFKVVSVKKTYYRNVACSKHSKTKYFLLLLASEATCKAIIIIIMTLQHANGS